MFKALSLVRQDFFEKKCQRSKNKIIYLGNRSKESRWFCYCICFTGVFILFHGCLTEDLRQTMHVVKDYGADVDDRLAPLDPRVQNIRNQHPNKGMDSISH